MAGRPVWQWLVIAVVGVILGLLIARRFRPAPEVVPDPTAGAGSGVDPVTGLEYGAEAIGGLTLGQDFASPASGGSVTVDSSDDDRTNADWLAAAAEPLYASFSAVLVDTALRKYLNGQPLTAKEVAVVEAALRANGAPPDGAPPIDRVTVADDTDVGPKPQPSGGGSPSSTSSDERIADDIRAIFSKYGLSVSGSRLRRLVREVRDGRELADIDRALRPFAKTGTSSNGSSSGGSSTYTVKRGDTYWDLAQRFYGDGTEWRRIANANPYPARDIPIGATLTIPS